MCTSSSVISVVALQFLIGALEGELLGTDPLNSSLSSLKVGDGEKVPGGESGREMKRGMGGHKGTD